MLSLIHICEPMDKAGAYGIQEKGAMFVKRINGDFYNVVGLPVARLASCLLYTSQYKVEYIETIARDKLGYAKPEERIYYIVPAD